VATQIVQRDRHAEYFSVLALIASSLEKFAIEIRHLSEPRSARPKNISRRARRLLGDAPQAQPRPVGKYLGLARLMRGYALAAMEDVPLWHERDISHSSVERVIGPTRQFSWISC